MSDNESVEHDHSQELFTKLSLRIQAANLPRAGILKSPPDTYAIITSVSGRFSRSGPIHASGSNGSEHVLEAVEWGRTEVVRKETHPQWTETFDLNYEFGSECYFLVQVYRLVGAGRKIESLGNAVCEIGDILGSKNHTKVKRLPKGGVVFCRLEPIREENIECVFRFRFAAKDLVLSHGKRNLLSPFSNAPNTILQISKRHPNASRLAWITVYRSSPVDNSLNPVWDIGEVDLASICNGDYDRPLRLAVLVHRKKGKNLLVGQCETTLRMILNTESNMNSTEEEKEASTDGFPLQRSLSKAKEVGRLQVRLAQVMDLVNDTERSVPFDIHMSMANLPPQTVDPYAVDIASLPTPIAAPASFQEYVQGGWKLDFCVAIDFTSSNGDPRIPGTLHDQSPISLNDFEETIVSIGNAVAPYTQELPSTVWGFGCKFGGVVRHLFQCGSSTEVHGVDGILEAYKSVFESDLTMSGPTLFDSVIQAAAVRARKHRQTNTQRYCILLIITDGISQEMEETKRKLRVYGSVPLSVIFVGVGRNDFHAMYDLCEDPQASSSGGRCMTSFVEFRNHQHDPTALGRSALKEIPSQFVHYMVQNDIQP